MKRFTAFTIISLTVQISAFAQCGWFCQNPLLPMYSVHFADNSTGWAVGLGGTIIRTTNGGTNWTAQASATTYILNSVHFADNNTGWAVGDYGIILRTTTGGTNWTPQTSGTNYELHSIDFADNNTGWAVGVGGRILKTTTGGLLVGIQIISAENPEQFSLSQNYPNPFNPATTIAFGIPQSANVTLKIFDMAGREVKTLVNEYRDAGCYVAKFDGSSLASGTYIYRLESSNFVSVKKMVLLK